MTPEAQATKIRSPQYHALDRNILAVATLQPWGPVWIAYIGVVPGKNHDEEHKQVLETGTKLRERIARVLFPDFQKIEYDA